LKRTTFKHDAQTSYSVHTNKHRQRRLVNAEHRNVTATNLIIQQSMQNLPINILLKSEPHS